MFSQPCCVLCEVRRVGNVCGNQILAVSGENCCFIQMTSSNFLFRRALKWEVSYGSVHTVKAEGPGDVHYARAASS